jgi:hypothetical protein
MILAISLLFIFLSQPTKIFAKEQYYTEADLKLTLTVDKTSALADGKDKIKVTFGQYRKETATYSENYGKYMPDCQLPDYIGAPNELKYNSTFDIEVLISGTKNIYKWIGEFNCSTGQISFELTTQTSEVKKITVQPVNDRGSYEEKYPINLNVTFTNPTPSKTVAPKPTTAPTPTPKPTPSKPTIQLTSMAKVKSTNKIITIASQQTKPIIRQNEKFTLSGTTSPNAKVTLIIHSNPIAQEVTANNKGEWTYTLDPQILKLPIGEHTVTTVATNSQGIKSDELTLTSFTLKNSLKPQASIQEEKYNWFNLTNLVAVAILSCLIGFFMFLHKNNKENDEI